MAALKAKRYRPWRKRNKTGNLVLTEAHKKVSDVLRTAEKELWGSEEEMIREAHRMSEELKRLWLESGRTIPVQTESRPQAVARKRNNRLRKLGLLPPVPKKRWVEW